MTAIPGRMLTAVLTVTLAVVTGTVAQASAPNATGRPQRSAHVVIAVIEKAVNVYHHDLTAPDRTGNPAGWLAGYPISSKPLRLRLNERDFAAARHKDDATWAALKPSQLYYLPGTRFSGLVWLPNALDKATSQFSVNYPPPTDPPRPVIDGYTYHGTGVASVAAGTRYGTCPDCDIVIVAADNPEDGLAWAAQQPWIDVISNSWGGPFGVPAQASASHPERAAATGASAGSLAAATAGKAVVFGSGNGVSDLGPATHGTQHGLTWVSPYAGPPWVLTIGAAKAGTGQPTDWHDIPVDVIAQGEDRPAAGSASLTGEEPSSAPPAPPRSLPVSSLRPCSKPGRPQRIPT